MQNFDPYSVLGLARTAEPAAIKAAYRKKVQVTHPDRGGKQDDFVVVVRAFGVLSDPEAKKLFDETGIVNEEAVRSYRDDVAKILADLFDTAVKTTVELGLPLDKVNFIEQMKSAVRSTATEADKSLGKLENEIRSLVALRSRIKRDDAEDNMFAARLSTQIKAKTDERSAVRRRVSLLESATTELGNYRDEVELVAALQVEAVSA